MSARNFMPYCNYDPPRPDWLFITLIDKGMKWKSVAGYSLSLWWVAP